jgi:phenylacetate-CoA ligase
MTEISPNYLIVLRRENYSDSMEVRVELIDSSLLDRYGELVALQKRIQDNIKNILGIAIKVTLVEPNSIERFTGKAKRVLDLRNQ